MSPNVLIVVGYYVVALVAFTAWTYADHATTRRAVGTSTDRSDRLVDRFVHRIAAALGVVAAVGTGLLLTLLLDPPPTIVIVLALSLGDGVVTFALAEIVLRFWGRWFGTDLLADLRASGRAHPHDAADSDDPPASPGGQPRS
jgi:hypothetical protein